jgi:hypothetical protein
MSFLAVFAGVIFAAACYRLKKGRLRHPTLTPGAAQKLLGNDTATVFAAAGVFVVVAIFLLAGSTSIETVREERLTTELSSYRAMATVLGQQLATASAETSDANKVLVFDMLGGDLYERYHDAAVEGLKEGLGGAVEVTTHRFRAEPKEEDTTEIERADALLFNVHEFDELARKHEDHLVVVSLMGLPTDFENSAARLQFSRAKRFFGVFEDNVYLHGATIAQGEITACVAPKREFDYDTLDPVPAGDVKALFDQRYILIHAENVIEVAKEYPRMFKRLKRLI